MPRIIKPQKRAAPTLRPVFKIDRLGTFFVGSKTAQKHHAGPRARRLSIGKIANAAVMNSVRHNGPPISQNASASTT